MALRDEILALPAELLATQSEAAIAAALNQPRPAVGSVSRQEFAMWTGSTGMRAVIEDKANDPNSPLRSIALTCRDFILGAADNLDLSLDLNKAMLKAWVDSGLLSQADHDALISMATKEVPFTPVTEHDVSLVCRNFDKEWVL